MAGEIWNKSRKLLAKQKTNINSWIIKLANFNLGISSRTSKVSHLANEQTFQGDLKYIQKNATMILTFSFATKVFTNDIIY